MNKEKELIDKLIDLAFAEDIGDGDHTTLCCIPETAMGKSQLIIKEDGVLAGVEMAKRIFHDFDPELKMTVFIQDGAEVKKGDIAFVVEGKIQSLLQTERLMLNVMQRMSGIATTTRKYAKALEGTKTHVLDTRKTTPGMRMIDSGDTFHRFSQKTLNFHCRISPERIGYSDMRNSRIINILHIKSSLQIKIDHRKIRHLRH